MPTSEPHRKPSTVLAAAASPILPFLELARVHRPAGSIQIFYPYLYGLLFAGLTTPIGEVCLPTLPELFTFQIPLLLLSAALLRSYGCVWNDICDVEIDRQVERTRNRPLPRGAISLPAAYVFLAGLVAAWVLSVGPLVPNSSDLSTYMIPLFLLVMAYPFGKRVTDYAQVVLGITVGWGVLLGAAMAGFDVLGRIGGALRVSLDEKRMDPAFAALKEPRILGLLSLYATNVIWSVIYDTIYAFQDVADDRKIGMKSMAIRVGDMAKGFLGVLSALQGILLAYTGVLLSRGHGDKTNFAWEALRSAWPYHCFAVVGGTVCLVVMVVRVDLGSPRSCAWWFKNGSTLVSSMIGLGFLAQYLARGLVD